MANPLSTWLYSYLSLMLLNDLGAGLFDTVVLLGKKGAILLYMRLVNVELAQAGCFEAGGASPATLPSYAATAGLVNARYND